MPDEQKLVYEPMAPMTRGDAMRAVEVGDTDRIVHAVLGIALHDADWRWAQDFALRMLKDGNVEIQRIALLGLGHIARIHGQLDLVALRRALDVIDLDAEYTLNNRTFTLNGAVDDMYSDINIFLKCDPSHH